MRTPGKNFREALSRCTHSVRRWIAIFEPKRAGKLGCLHRFSVDLKITHLQIRLVD